MRRHNSIFTRFLISYLLTIIVPVSLLVAFMFITFGQMIEDEFLNRSSEILNQNMNTIESKLRDVRALNLALVNDERISFYGREESDYLSYTVSQQLRGYCSVNHYFSDISIYIRGRDSISSASGIGNIRNFSITKFNMLESENLRATLNNCETPTVLHWGDEMDFISIIYPFPYIGKSRGSVIVFVDRNAVNTTLSSSVAGIENSNVVILDDKGGLFARLNDQYSSVYSSIFEKSDMQNINHERLVIDGVKCLITYKKSDITGYVYMNVIPENSVAANKVKGDMRVLLFAIGACLSGSVIIVYFMRLNYNPIGLLIKKLNNESNGVVHDLNALSDAFDSMIDTKRRLEHQVTQTHAVVRKQLFQKLLTGNLSELYNCEEIIEGMGVNDHAYMFGVVLILADNKENKWLRSDGLFSNHFYGGIKIYEVDALQANCLIFILSFHSDIKDEIPKVLASLEICIKGFLESRFTIGVGTFKTDIMKLSQSYVEAMSALDWRFVNGIGGIIRFDELPNVNKNLGRDALLNAEALSNCIISGDVNDVRMFITQSINSLRTSAIPLYVAKCFCLDMVNIIVRTIKNLNINIEALNDIYIQAIQIVEYQTLDDIKSYIVNICEQICNAISDSRGNVADKLYDELKKYISEHCFETDFSLDNTARHFNLSYGHLSKYFKEQFGCNFSDYISVLRIEQAKKLLSTTDMTIESIVMQIGYLNVPSFNRKFKKVVGVAPGEWRRLNNCK